MKNALKLMILFLIVGVVFQGCAAKNDKIMQNDIKRIGQPNYGFVDIPSNWVIFKDVDVSQPIIQYSDLSGKAVITLNAVKMTGNDAKTVASSIWTNMESQGAQNIVGATVKLGGNTAFQVYGLYPKEGLMLVTWSFEANDGYLHYVSVESPKDNIMDLVDRTEKSFSLEK